MSLRNFCQHSKLDLNFPSGILAIGGPNGAGKSNCVKAIFAALTGIFGRNDGVITDNINSGCGEKEESYISLTFSVGETVAVITRNLRPNKRSLVLNGGDPITSMKEVNATVEGLIGVRLEILSDYIFVDQLKMLGVFDLAKSEKFQHLQTLYGLEKSETCYEELNKKSLGIEVFKPSETLESISVQLEEKKRDLAEAKIAMAANSHLNLDDSYVKTRLSLTISKKHGKNIIKSNIGKIRELEPQIEELKKIIANLSESREDLLKSFPDSINLEELTRIKKEWETIDNFDKVRAENLKERDIIEAQIVSLGSPPDKEINYMSSDGVDFSNLSILLGTVSSKEENLEKLLSKKECPVCGSTGDILIKAMHDISVSIQEIKPKLNSMKMAWDKSRAFDKALYKYESEASSIQSRLQKVNFNLSIQRPEVPRIDKIDVFGAIDKYHSFRKSIADIDASILRSTAELNRSESSKSTMAAQVSEASTFCDMLEDYESQEALLNAEMNSIHKNKEIKIRIEEKIKSLEDQVFYLCGRHDKIKADMEESSVNSMVRLHLDDLKSIMHRDNLPKHLTVNYLRSTVKKLNGYLDDFSVKFSIMVDDDLTFWATLSDGTVIAASRLSGGEKVVLSLAFRLAVQSDLNGINLLVLDEPTVCLDDDNIACLEKAFDRLRAMSKSSGLQVIVVSHESAIERMCDHTFTLNR
jgi:DNA repair exonuclease SbcCD ATPase subunit